MAIQFLRRRLRPRCADPRQRRVRLSSHPAGKDLCGAFGLGSFSETSGSEMRSQIGAQTEPAALAGGPEMGRMANSGSHDEVCNLERAVAKDVTAPPACHQPNSRNIGVCWHRFTGGGSVYRGFADASPFAAGLLALGFCELIGGLFWFVC